MKHENQKELLEDLYSGGGGPQVEKVLGLLRRDRTLRKRRKLVAAGGALFLVGAAMVALWEGRPEVAPPVQVAEMNTQETVERISDEELLAAIGRPAALKTLPDGRQSVIFLAPMAQQ